MSLKDSRGVPISSANAQAVARYEQAADLLLAFSGRALDAIDALLAEEPGFVSGYCLKAAMLAMVNDRTVRDDLRATVEAGAAVPGGNDRERRHLAAARAWLEGDWQRALAIWGRLAIDYPRDTLALQVAHAGDFYLGQSIMLRDRIARALAAWDEGVPGFGFLLGMHAFGMEETGDYAAAEHAGRRAVELHSHDTWAIHAVAHVLEMQGRTVEGIEWLETRSEDWGRPDSLFAIHNAWHLALYHLEQGDHARVLALYDERIRAGRSLVALDMVDAAAMLWRLYLRGVEVGDRWNELADAWEPAAEDGAYAFNDVHAMMALVGAGRERQARALLQAMKLRAFAPGSNAAMVREVGLPVARALYAFGLGDYDTVTEILEPVRQIAAHRFGGSHAQRDVLHLTLVEAALRGGQTAHAHAFAAERYALRPESKLNRRLMRRAQRLVTQDTVRARAAVA
jgi:hypothetical protein